MKILFVSPYCLIDPASGASISCRAILRSLVAKDHSVTAISATVFDRPSTKAPEEFLARIGAQRLSGEGDKALWAAFGGGVRYFVTIAKAQRRMDMTAREEAHFEAVVRRVIDQISPDVVLAYGGQLLDLAIYRYIHDLGVPLIFYLVNPTYKSAATFRDVTAIVTDTTATANLYKERLDLDVTPIGKFITPFPKQRMDARTHVVFINPSPAKGVAMFVAIVREASRRGLDARFLVVESRASLAPALAAFGVSVDALPNVERWPLQLSMRKVWSVAKVLLYPSYWHESGPRSVLEACSAGVPVLATRTGGVEQILNGGGDLFDRPAGALGEGLQLDDYGELPSQKEVAPWVDRLETLLSDDAAYAAASARAYRAWSTNPYVNNLKSLEEIIEKLTNISTGGRILST